MRPPRDPVLDGRCFGCRMPAGACFCAEVPSIATATRIVIVRHCAEIAMTSNTGRLAARALSNCVMVDHGLPGQPVDLSTEVGEDAWVLFPGGGPVPVAPRPRTLVVLDGTWSQVRGMRWRIPPLPRLRALSLPAPVVAPLRIRRPRSPDQLATIEALAAALDVVGEPGPADALRAIFAVMARRMRDLRGFDMPAKSQPPGG